MLKVIAVLGVLGVCIEGLPMASYETINGFSSSRFLAKRETAASSNSTWPDSPLLIAAQNNDAETVQILIENGANVSAADSMGWTALHWAARFDNVPMAKLLIEHGANIEQPALWGAEKESGQSNETAHEPTLTPLILASYCEAVGVAKLLLDHGADPNEKSHYTDRTDNTMTVLYFAIFGKNDTNDTEKSSLEIVKLLVERGADVNVKNRNGWTPLHHAIRMNDAPVVEYLLDHGADPTAKAKSSDEPNDAERTFTPLIFAAYYSKGHHPSMVKLLLMHGLKP